MNQKLRTEDWALSAMGRQAVENVKNQLGIKDDDLALELAEKLYGPDSLYELPED